MSNVIPFPERKEDVGKIKDEYQKAIETAIDEIISAYESSEIGYFQARDELETLGLSFDEAIMFLKGNLCDPKIEEE